MKKLHALFIGLLCSSFAWSQSNPSPFDLASGTYLFSSWPATSTPGTYPANMVLQLSRDGADNLFNPLAPGESNFTCAYNLSANSRFAGKGTAGIGFLNTATSQLDNCTTGSTSVLRFVGSALLALNSTNRDGIIVSWTAGTVVAAGLRPYVVQLQYRLGTSGNFTVLPNTTYTAGATGNAQAFTIMLPVALNNQPVVQLRWVYYQSSAGTDSRPEMRLDDISVGSTALPVTYLNFQAKYTGEKMVAVSWATVAETDNAHFEVERSVDALSYASLGRVAGKGTITNRQNYTLTDEAPAPGWNYYRLRQVDQSGLSAVSRTIAIYAEKTVPTLRVWPNPASNDVTISLGKGQPALTVRLLNLLGTSIRETSAPTLSLGDLPEGLYMVEVTASDGVTHRQRLLKR